MSSDWFSSKLPPNGDVEDGCHHEEVEALKDYLRHKTIAADTAQAITRPIVASENPRDDLPRLYVLLLGALVELPSEYIAQLLALLQAIEDLPAPDFAALRQSKQPHKKLWKGLSHFGNAWYDVGYRSGSRKMDVERTRGSKRDSLRDEHFRKAEVEARLVRASLANI